MASVLIAVAMSLNSHLDRKDIACGKLFSELENLERFSSVIVDLYQFGNLREELVDQIKFTERMHRTSIKQCTGS